MNKNFNQNNSGDNSIFNTESADKSFFEYLLIFRENLIPMILIIVASVATTLFYLYNATTVYSSTTVLKVENSDQNILKDSYFSEPMAISAFFIANQLQILEGFEVRDRVAGALLDSLEKSPDRSVFYHLVYQGKYHPVGTPRTLQSLRIRLGAVVDLKQKEMLNAIEISCESPNFHEAALITNVYAEKYIEYINEIRKQDISTLKKFLDQEKQGKLNELSRIEEKIESFKSENEISSIETFTTDLIEHITKTETNLADTRSLLSTSKKLREELLSQYKSYDSTYIERLKLESHQASLVQIERDINRLEIKRDLELAEETDLVKKQRIMQVYSDQLNTIQEIKKAKIKEIEKVIDLASTPEKKEIVNRLFLNDVEQITLENKINLLMKSLNKLNSQLSKLPEINLEIAKLQREKSTNEKLYMALEEKFQETEIIERTRVSDAYILDPGTDSPVLVRPKRNRIISMGIVLGILLGIGFALVRNYFDRTIKNPEQIEKLGGTILAWIPTIDGLKSQPGSPARGFVVANNTSSNAKESFKALRTRVQFAKLEGGGLKTILVTSSLPGEGKTLVSLNLAGSFALNDKKTLVIDCDLRKPRVHQVFEVDKHPGLTDYLFDRNSLEDVIRPTSVKNLSFITSGTIPPNPSELLGSQKMKDLLKEMNEKYDIVIIDSPPIVSVTDSEILFNVVDGTILIGKAQQTDIELFMKTYAKLYNMNSHNFLGGVLNDFSAKTGYGYYYKYYYYYSRPETKKDRAENAG